MRDKYGRFLKGYVSPYGFKKGMTSFMKGKKHTKEAKEKNRLAHLGKHFSSKTEFKKGMKSWNAGLKGTQSGGSNGMWKGDDVGYDALHRWIYRILGELNFCNRCKSTKSKRFMWHNLSGEYKRDITDWERVCARCHIYEHKPWEGRIKYV